MGDFAAPEFYKRADKSLARPDCKKQLKGRHFSSDVVVIPAAETCLDEQLSEFILSGLQKLEIGRCSLFPFWSGWGLISTLVRAYVTEQSVYSIFIGRVNKKTYFS